MYADTSLNVTEELIEHVSSQGQGLDVEKLIGHRFNARINDYEL